MEKIPMSALIDSQLDIARTNYKEELRYALVDADAGIVASLYKRSTEEVDFIGISMSNRTENDLPDFNYGLVGFSEEDGMKELLQAQENGENAYLRGKDVRLVGRELTEEERPNFEEEGYEIFDINTFMQQDAGVDNIFDDYRRSGDTKTFTVDGGAFERFIHQLNNERKVKDWANIGLIHMQPLWSHNPLHNEFMCRLHFDGALYTAEVPVVREGKLVPIAYDVDILKSRQHSLEIPEENDFEDFPNGIPMICSLIKSEELDENNQLVVREVAILKRPFQRGLRMSAQNVGTSGIRLPVLEKHYRPVTVTAAKAHHISLDHIATFPFTTKQNEVTNALPFTIGYDDLLRLSKLFMEGDVVRVTYLSVLERQGILPVKFEMYREYSEKDAAGNPYFDRKVAMVASVMPLVNGKVIVQ